MLRLGEARIYATGSSRLLLEGARIRGRFRLDRNKKVNFSLLNARIYIYIYRAFFPRPISSQFLGKILSVQVRGRTTESGTSRERID